MPFIIFFFFFFIEILKIILNQANSEQLIAEIQFRFNAPFPAGRINTVQNHISYFTYVSADCTKFDQKKKKKKSV